MLVLVSWHIRKVLEIWEGNREVPDFLDKSQKCTDISAIYLKFVKFAI
jgi:hypothetical protein